MKQLFLKDIFVTLLPLLLLIVPFLMIELDSEIDRSIDEDVFPGTQRPQPTPTPAPSQPSSETPDNTRPINQQQLEENPFLDEMWFV